jgi:hypothetical protein
VTIPANTTGWLEVNAGEAAKYKVDGFPLTDGKLAKAVTRGGESGFEIAPGSYTFVVEL